MLNKAVDEENECFGVGGRVSLTVKLYAIIDTNPASVNLNIAHSRVRVRMSAIGRKVEVTRVMAYNTTSFT